MNTDNDPFHIENQDLKEAKQILAGEHEIQTAFKLTFEAFLYHAKMMGYPTMYDNILKEHLKNNPQFNH